MARSDDFALAAWPLPRLGEALEALARHAGLAGTVAGDARDARDTDGLALPAELRDGAPLELERWVDWAAARLGAEAEAVDAAVPEVGALLQGAGPALLLFRDPADPQQALQVLLLVGRRGRALWLLGPDGHLRRGSVAAVRDRLCDAFERPLRPELDRLLAEAEVPVHRRDAVRAWLLADRLQDQRVAGCWLLRAPAGASFARQCVLAGLPQRVAALVAVFALLYTVEIAGWRAIGEGALGGRLDSGWLAAWVLLLLTLVPLRLASGWLDAHLALATGRLLKQRLLAGALRLDLDLVRRLGAGQWLGRVMESQALEALALNGGLAVAVGLLELGFAAAVLALGAAAGWHLALLGAWLLLTALLTRRYAGRLRQWTTQRLAMTQDLVERMVGHRSCLAQDRPARRDARDDRTLADYQQQSRRLDDATTPIVAGLPGGWMLLALAGLAPALLAAPAQGQAAAHAATALAISLGGILLAHRALGGISGGLGALARAGLAWRQVGTLFRAGAQPPALASFVGAARQAGGAAGSPTPLVDASGLGFRYPTSLGADDPDGPAAPASPALDPAPVLQGLDLRVAHGERILLEGPSGGGKSTLAALLTGLRQPGAGLLLLQGLDRHTLGEGWHRLAAEAPQFHENHVLTGTLAFNLLMGRRWPAGPVELDEAQALCEELGLGELIARMPGGLAQRIGETGWQLSHGERSRLFLARALLQQAPLTVLDESFAALDPATLQRCLEAALRRSATLVVIAHP